MKSSKVYWPPDLRPENSPVYSYNELEIGVAEAELIWSWLIRAESWSSWYPNCKDLRILKDEGPNLEAGSEFDWTTFGVRVKTRVDKFIPYEALSWRGSGLGAEGYHIWIIEPLKYSYKVITEEVQRGFVPYVGRYPIKKLLLKYHQIWLEGLARMVRSGLSPGIKGGV